MSGPDIIVAEGYKHYAIMVNASANFCIFYDDGITRGDIRLNVNAMCHAHRGSFGRVNESRLVAFNSCIYYDSVYCPRITILTYANNANMSGIATERHGLIAANLFAHQVLRVQLGIPASVRKFRLTNVVAKTIMPEFSHEGLVMMSEEFGARCEYDPLVFTSARIKGRHSASSTFLISASGSIVITGLRGLDSIRECLREAHEDFLKFTKEARTAIIRNPTSTLERMTRMLRERERGANAMNANLHMLKGVKGIDFIKIGE